MIGVYKDVVSRTISVEVRFNIKTITHWTHNMGKNTDLSMMFMNFVIHAVASKHSEDPEDVIYQVGQAKGMLFTLKVLGFDIDDLKNNCISSVEMASHTVDTSDGVMPKKDILELIEDIYKDTVDHIDQIVGGMLLDDAQRP